MVQLWRSFSWLIPVVAIGGGVVFVVAAFTSWARGGCATTGASVRRATLDGVISVWVVAVAAITLLPGSAATIPGEGPTVDLVPFHDLADQIVSSASWEVPVVQIGGNLVLFASGGLLLGLRAGWGWRGSLWRFAVLGVVIETSQLVVGGRTAVVDDVLLVVLGGVLGAAAGRGLRGSGPSGAARAHVPVGSEQVA